MSELDYSKWRLSDKPCEKCGNKTVRVSLRDEMFERGTYYHIHCTNCGMDYKVDGPDS